MNRKQTIHLHYSGVLLPIFTTWSLTGTFIHIVSSLTCIYSTSVYNPPRKSSANKSTEVRPELVVEDHYYTDSTLSVIAKIDLWRTPGPPLEREGTNPELVDDNLLSHLSSMNLSRSSRLGPSIGNKIRRTHPEVSRPFLTARLTFRLAIASTMETSRSISFDQG